MPGCRRSIFLTEPTKPLFIKKVEGDGPGICREINGVRYHFVDINKMVHRFADVTKTITQDHFNKRIRINAFLAIYREFDVKTGVYSRFLGHNREK